MRTPMTGVSLLADGKASRSPLGCQLCSEGGLWGPHIDAAAEAPSSWCITAHGVSLFERRKSNTPGVAPCFRLDLTPPRVSPEAFNTWWNPCAGSSVGVQERIGCQAMSASKICISGNSRLLPRREAGGKHDVIHYSIYPASHAVDHSLSRRLLVPTFPPATPPPECSLKLLCLPLSHLARLPDPAPRRAGVVWGRCRSQSVSGSGPG
jgi:hypothetical protein